MRSTLRPEAISCLCRCRGRLGEARFAPWFMSVEVSKERTRRIPPPARLLVAVLAGVSAICIAPGSAAYACDLCERESLTGNWGGARETLEAHGLELDGDYIGDVIANVRGGHDRHTVYLGNLDLTLTAHLEDLTGLPLGTMFVYGLVNHGGRPSKHVGDLQGVDNIEAPSTAKLYEMWWQDEFLDHRLSLLAGLYDLNSEFDVIESAAVFVHSSYGIGPELSQSGRNGASVFPTTALALRAKTLVTDRIVLQMAALDGVPGDLGDPHGTQVNVSRDQGAMLIAEGAWVLDDDGGEDAVSLARQRRERVGRGWGEVPYRLKLAAGVWGYTSKLDDLSAVNANGQPVRRQSHPGVYFLADTKLPDGLFAWPEEVSVFFRAGFADERVTTYVAYAGGGVAVTGLLPSRKDDLAGFGVAAAFIGSSFRRALRNEGEDPADAEVALEWTYRAALTPWLALQPDLQFVIDPGGIHIADALVLGMRFEVDF